MGPAVGKTRSIPGDYRSIMTPGTEVMSTGTEFVQIVTLTLRVAGLATLTAWRKEITLLMQSPYLFSGSVAWNVAYGLRARHLSGRFPSERIIEAFRTVGMEHFLNRNVRDLSGGERSRVALARALVLSPQVFLLDEPTAHLDTLWSRRMHDIAQQVRNRNGTTVIFSTQRPEEAKHIADETIYLKGGRLADGQPSNMFIGQVIADGEVKEIEIEGKLRIYANIEAEGKVIVEVEPEDIILSSEPFLSSARNHFIGTISRLEKADRGHPRCGAGTDRLEVPPDRTIAEGVGICNRRYHLLDLQSLVGPGPMRVVLGTPPLFTCRAFA